MGRVLGSLHRGGLGIASLSILVMTVLGGLDVLSTTVLNRPIPTTLEATEALMVLVVFLSLGALQDREGHIAVDLLVGRLPSRAQRVIRVGSRLLTLCFFSLIAWKGWELAMQSLAVGEYASGIVPFPLYPSKFGLAAGATLASIQCLSDLVANRGNTDAEGSA